MISRPTQLPEVRAEVIAWFSKVGPMFFAACIKAGEQPIRPDMPDAEAGSYLAGEEIRRLHEAELYWVDANMTDLTLAAAASMPAFSLQPEDLPSPAGIIVFEKPIQRRRENDDFADPIFIRAAAWGSTSRGPGVLWVSWYTDTAMNFEAMGPDQPSKKRGLTPAAAGMPPLTYEIEEIMAFSETPLPAFDQFTGEILESGSSYPQKELVTAWTLMQQPIAKTRDADFDRTGRRRLQRSGIDPKPVRVISLRRPASTAGEQSESGREYHHKWIVRGHWRQQWYPSREVHRPVWIAPHIKGPEDAPLLGGDKVYSWTQ